MKESETPLGKAYAKAKADVNPESDSAQRRYVTFQYSRGPYVFNLIGNKTTGKVTAELRDVSSNKLIKTISNDITIDEISGKKLPNDLKQAFDEFIPDEYDSPYGRPRPRLAPGFPDKRPADSRNKIELKPEILRKKGARGA
jgi:hypothetical protein